jgi:hypothetical protein
VAQGVDEEYLKPLFGGRQLGGERGLGGGGGGDGGDVNGSEAAYQGLADMQLREQGSSEGAGA